MSVPDNSATSPFMCGVEVPITFHYDWANEEALSAFIIQQMIEETGVDSSDVPESLYQCIDPDALEDLFQPLQDGTPRTSGAVTFNLAGHYVTANSDGTIEIESELGRLKRTGGNLLLTGDVPADVFEQLSAQFLGDVTYDRTHLFALYGRDADVARTLLTRANANPDHAHALSYEAAVRSTTQAQTNEHSNQLRVTPVVGSIDDLETTIREEIFERQRQQMGFDPGELRFCFDSLQLLCSEEDTQTVNSFLRTIAETIEEVSGLGQYIFPGAYESSPVQAVKSLFDVTVELKIGEQGPEQRWHLHDTDYTTTWFPI
ncbi:DUF7504 family protein [Haladaptatus cibarius]|uniref:DUF7504 family protein n=1 Tax=Haladaptatus cibarius TaxID=453847 RepID=UPI000679BDA3|nr:HalOD1 output domain-containing protein [Haladaptatus cibarius]